MDGAGNLYLADDDARIRKVTAGTGIITTVAGTGTYGYNGDNIAATAAEVYWPNGVALDGAGNLYIADYNNNRVRKVQFITVASGAVNVGQSSAALPIAFGFTASTQVGSSAALTLGASGKDFRQPGRDLQRGHL